MPPYYTLASLHSLQPAAARQGRPLEPLKNLYQDNNHEANQTGADPFHPGRI